MRPGENSGTASSSIWETLQTTDSPQPRTRKPKKSEIVHYPEFEQALAYLDDNYWIEIFENCARKKLPRGFAYADYQLKFRKTDQTILLPDSPHDFAIIAISFFQEYGRLFSERDQSVLRHRKEEHLNHLNILSNDWKKVARTKFSRANYIREFVETHFKSFPQDLQNEHFTRINLAFELKILTNEHVIFANNKIQQITALEIKEDGAIHFTNQGVKKQSKPRTQVGPNKEKCHQHYENWCKYMDNYHKHLLTVDSGRPISAHRPKTDENEEGDSP